MIEISIVVCTFNRADSLLRTLVSCLEQRFERDRYEILVVDNASTDETADRIKEFSDNPTKPPIVYVYEGNPGLGYARNVGLRCCRGDLVAYLDDDALADPDWLKGALECFQAVEPRPVVVGGPIIPFYPSKKPAWFKDEYEMRTWGDRGRFLARGEKFSGSNMIFSKSVLEKCGGFEESVGMRGDKMSFGEESSVFEKLWGQREAVPALYYSPAVVVYHAVPDWKMTVSYQLKRIFARGQAWAVRRQFDESSGRLSLSVRIASKIVWFGLLSLSRRRQYSRTENWVVESLAPVADNLGRLAATLGIACSVRATGHRNRNVCHGGTN